VGWEDVKDMQSGTVERTITDDTLPGGPREKTIVYHAPFDRCDREQDYETVWAEFEKRFGKSTGITEPRRDARPCVSTTKNPNGRGKNERTNGKI